MGWLVFHDYTREDLLSHLRKSLVTGGRTILRSSAVGNNFWGLLCLPDASKVVVHAILQGGTRTSPGWGYKELSHRDGNDCPVDYLRFLPDTMDARELEWRESVRAHHRKQTEMRKLKAGLKPGAVLKLGGKQYQLDASLGSRGWEVTCLDDGQRYRMPAKHVTKAIQELTK